MRMMYKYYVEGESQAKKATKKSRPRRQSALRLPYWCPVRRPCWRKRERSSTVVAQCGTLERSSRSKETVIPVDTSEELESR